MAWRLSRYLKGQKVRPLAWTTGQVELTPSGTGEFGPVQQVADSSDGGVGAEDVDLLTTTGAEAVSISALALVVQIIQMIPNPPSSAPPQKRGPGPQARSLPSLGCPFSRV